LNFNLEMTGKCLEDSPLVWVGTGGEKDMLVSVGCSVDISVRVRPLLLRESGTSLFIGARLWIIWDHWLPCRGEYG
jgi:hypothetical protein